MLKLIQLGRKAIGVISSAAPAMDLLLRLWVGHVFFKSGLTKIQSWETTVSLFENEYKVPVLPAELAAYMGTAAELVLPVFLVLGLGGRAAALALFVFNIVAVASYPDLGEVGLEQHKYWGLMLLVTMVHGPGKWSIDHLLVCRWGASSSWTRLDSDDARGAKDESKT